MNNSSPVIQRQDGDGLFTNVASKNAFVIIFGWLLEGILAVLVGFLAQGNQWLPEFGIFQLLLSVPLAILLFISVKLWYEYVGGRGNIWGGLAFAALLALAGSVLAFFYRNDPQIGRLILWIPLYHLVMGFFGFLSLIGG